MTNITSTALAAGARETCVKPAAETLPGMGSISLQPAFRPVLRREIMAAVNTCGRDLGLRQGALVVLDALLSCLPCQGAEGREAPVTPTTLLTVYASNETLCFRAKGLTDRQLRRHLETLEAAGLLRRRDSANGKRFPVLKGGKPVGAFGLDLSPLFAQADALLALARRRREEAHELRGLKAQILRLRAACLERAPDETTTAFLDSLRNLLRRATLTLLEARAMLAQLTAVLTQGREDAIPEPSLPAEPDSTDAMPEPRNLIGRSTQGATPETGPVMASGRGTDTCEAAKSTETPGAAGQNVRHIEPESDTKKTDPMQRLKPTASGTWSDLTEISTFYPEPACPRHGIRIAFEFGRMLRISQELLVIAASKLGLWRLLRLEDQIARKSDSIENPDAYLRAILQT